MFLVSCFVVAQDVEPGQDSLLFGREEIEQREKLGVVHLSGESSVELKFPDLFLGDPTLGKVLLVNDSNMDAAISDVTTSCGCTSAIPIERRVASQSSNLLLIDYLPKSAGKMLVEARFRFGEKDFHLAGVANTKPRLSQTASSLTFDQFGKAKIEILKHAPAPINRLVIFPPSLKAEHLLDTPEKFTATINRDPNRTPVALRLAPANGEVEYPEFQYQLRYPGVVEVLPRRVVSSEGVAKFYLRGDVSSITNAKEITLTSDGVEQKISCTVSPAGVAVSVSFMHSLAPGEYEINAKIGDVSFSLPMTVR